MTKPPLSTRTHPSCESDVDLYATTIARVDAELESALESLDGWAENVLAHEQDRFAELRAAWRLQAERIRQLDRLLATTQQLDPSRMPIRHSVPDRPGMYGTGRAKRLATKISNACTQSASNCMTT